MKKRYSLSTVSGCIRTLLLLFCVVLVSGLIAQIISTNGGKIKQSQIRIDSRGAELSFDQYVPAGTSDKDSLPAVVVIHGGGCPAGVMRGVAEEIARRGFVVVNLNAYGAGTSEQPLYDEGGQGVDGFNPFATPQGVLDAVNYLRTLNFVDKTKIGLVGHSLGATRSSLTAVLDCGYFSLNDLLINKLCNQFSLTLDENEIYEDADDIAAKYLNADQLAFYENIKTETAEYYNSRIKSICILGTDGGMVMPQSVVEVAGHEVNRSLQTNIFIVNGTYDTNGRGTPGDLEPVISGLHLTESAQEGVLYQVNDKSADSTVLGNYGSISVADDTALSDAIENRSVRMVKTNKETHSKNFFSPKTETDIIRCTEQGLSFNATDTSKAGAFVWRAIFNAIAMLAMIAMICPLIMLLTKTKFFAGCISPKKTIGVAEKTNKRSYWLFSLIIVIYTFMAAYFGNNKGIMRFPITHTWPLAGTAGNTLLFVFILAGCSLILVIIYALINKKKYGNTGINAILGGLKVSKVLKCLLLSLIALAFGYLMLAISEYLFNQDFRFWMTSFGVMRAELWIIAARYMLLFIPVFFLIGAVTNYSVRTDIPVWRDTLNNIIIGSLGVWLCCAVDLILCWSNYSGTHFAAFTCAYSLLLYVPITVYLNRKLYNVTNNIWTGAFVNAAFLAWSFTAAQTLSDAFFGQNFWSMFLGG